MTNPNQTAQIAQSHGIDLNTVTVGAELYDPKTRQISQVVEIKGRWVKLASGSSISRAAALLGVQEWFDDVLELHPEWLDEVKIGHNIVPEVYRSRYTRTRSANGNASLTCGDAVATLMAGLNVGRSEALATFAAGEPKSWVHLNAGQRVMNARNAVRRALKDGFTTMDDLTAVIGGIVA